MFFDSLGHNFKDSIIILFIIFTIVLSIYIIIFNSSLHWWNNNCNESSDSHKPNDIAVIIASIFLGIVGLTIIYTVYQYFKKGKIIGLNSFGN